MVRTFRSYLFVMISGMLSFLVLCGADDAKEEKRIRVGDAFIDVIYITPGEFLMGSPDTETGRYSDEGPRRRVQIKTGFWMGTTEVTQKLWTIVMGRNEAYFTKGDDFPLEWVSWDMVQEFIQKLNEETGLRFRLPSEAEWEYACRAGTKTAFNTGDSLGSRWANFNGTYPEGGAAKGIYRQMTTPVGMFEPNAWGLYDMHGNVWECCEDVYLPDAYAHPEYYTANTAGNPVVGAAGKVRVMRGGGWIANGSMCRSACRSGEDQRIGFNYMGFRLVLDD